MQRLIAIALFRTFAKNLSMTKAMHGWGSYELSRELSISMRDREILIDRTCARCGCEYEWGVHIQAFAGKAQLTPEQIASTVSGWAEDGNWPENEAALISTVSNGMFILGYTTGTIFIVTGAILLLAVTFDTVVRRLQVRSGR